MAASRLRLASSSNNPWRNAALKSFVCARRTIVPARKTEPTSQFVFIGLLCSYAARHASANCHAFAKSGLGSSLNQKFGLRREVKRHRSEERRVGKEGR